MQPLAQLTLEFGVSCLETPSTQRLIRLKTGLDEGTRSGISLQINVHWITTSIRICQALGSVEAVPRSVVGFGL